MFLDQLTCYRIVVSRQTLNQNTCCTFKPFRYYLVDISKLVSSLDKDQFRHFITFVEPSCA